MKAVWIAVIRFYQRWISPYKGFRCAHVAVHGELTCSEAVKRIIDEHGLWRGWRRIRQRLGECRAAARSIRSQSGRPLPDKPPVRVEPPDSADATDEQGRDSAPDPSSYFKSSRKRRWLDSCDADVVCCCIPSPLDGCGGCGCDLF